MLTPLTASQTLDRARAVLQSGRGAGLPELLKLIETLSTDLGEVTIAEVAELIEQDAAVLARLLTVANTVYHNPGIAPLASVHQAIHQVGFQRIRSLAVSLMLIENTGGARNPPEQREAAAHALCAGLLAQGLAQHCGTFDPETAFACAALRQFGHILLPAVSLEHYQAARGRLAAHPEAVAWRGVFGLTPLELSRRLLAAARLPEEVLHSLRDGEAAALARLPLSTDNRLLAAAELAGRLATVTLDARCGPDTFSEITHRLARPYERLLPDTEGALATALVHTDERVTGFTRSGGSGALPTASLARIKSRVRQEKPAGMTDALVSASAPPLPMPDLVPVPAETPEAAAGGAPAPTPPAGPANPPAPEEPWTEALARSRAFTTQSTTDGPAIDPWLAALTLVRDRFAAHEAWLFQAESTDGDLGITHGAGEYWRQFQAVARLHRDERTVFGVCLTRQETVVIHNLAEPALRPYLPRWLTATPGPAPRSFLIMPVPGAEARAGLVLIGWRHAQRLEFTPAQADLVRQLFRSAANPAAATAA